MVRTEASETAVDRNGRTLKAGDPVHIRGTRGGSWTFKRHVRAGDSEWIEVYGSSGKKHPATRSFSVDKVESVLHPLRRPDVEE